MFHNHIGLSHTNLLSKIPCRGPRPNTDFLSTLGEDALSATGHIRVKPTLQVKYHPRIFAAGDVIDWDEQKRAIKYVAHAKIVVGNVMSVLRDRQPNALYRGCYEAIVIANGKVCLIQFAPTAVVSNKFTERGKHVL